MAASSCPLDDFLCPVCLEILCDPATLACGHSYCLQCIQKHWDKASSKGQYSCPQCRQVFKPRPSLGRNNMLMEAMKKLRVGEQDKASVQPAAEASLQSGLYPLLPSISPNMCPVHKQLLELYCCDDKECVCTECSLIKHKGHRVVNPDEEKEKELSEKKRTIQRSVLERERIIQTLPEVIQANKTAIQRLQTDGLEIFGKAKESVEFMRLQVMDVLQAYETSAYIRIESNRYKLQEEITQLYKQDEELNRLSVSQDSIQFLKILDTTCGADVVGNSQLQILSPESVDSGIRSALEVFRDHLHDLCKESLACIFRAVNDAEKTATELAASEKSLNPNKLQVTSQNAAPELTYAPSNNDCKPKTTKLQHPAAASANSVEKILTSSEGNQAPKSREEMLKYRFEPTLDCNTAYRFIRLSDGDHKATLCAGNQKYPEHIERFAYWRQVMCREPLAGSPYYWEVEWTGQKVTIAVAYKDIGRSTADDVSRLGHNEHSWSLYWSGTAFSLLHAGKETVLADPKAQRIGVYVDQQKGVLAFYRVSHNQAHLICCVETEFRGALYPGFRFWTGVGCSITICQLG